MTGIEEVSFSWGRRAPNPGGLGGTPQERTTDELRPLCRLTRHIEVCTNMFSKLTHESHTKLPNFVVAFSLWIEICTTFSTTHVQASQGVFEDLFETKELQDTEIDGWMESETTFVWSESRVELNSVASVDLHLSFIVFPDYSELYYSLWDG